MRLTIAALIVGLALGFAQEPPEYPDGVFCSPAGDTSEGHIINPDHPCHCAKMGDPDTSCEMPVTNDPVCKQYCHEKHCSCPLVCPDPVGSR